MRPALGLEEMLELLVQHRLLDPELPEDERRQDHERADEQADPRGADHHSRIGRAPPEHVIGEGDPQDLERSRDHVRDTDQQ